MRDGWGGAYLRGGLNILRIGGMQKLKLKEVRLILIDSTDYCSLYHFLSLTFILVKGCYQVVK